MTTPELPPFMVAAIDQARASVTRCHNVMLDDYRLAAKKLGHTDFTLMAATARTMTGILKSTPLPEDAQKVLANAISAGMLAIQKLEQREEGE